MFSPYYYKKKSGFSKESNGLHISPVIYQPTPEGLKVLCAHYSAKYAIDLRSIDLREPIERYTAIIQLFQYLATHQESLDVAEGCARGLILSHGQNHAIPLFITKRNGQRHLICFDSTSGSVIKGYFPIAALFQDVHFYLNEGTRQADSTSCITDAVCILKEALLCDDLLALVTSKVLKEHKAFVQTRFFNGAPPTNFKLFKIPEQLLVTAQRPNYVDSDAGATMLRGGKTLHEYRDQFCIKTSICGESPIEVPLINSYLYIKSKWQRDSILYPVDMRRNMLALYMKEGVLIKGERMRPVSPTSEIQSMDYTTHEEELETPRTFVTFCSKP